VKKIILPICCFIYLNAFPQDTLYIKLHFLYGSKPLKKYKTSEKKWFGGILGGHAGIERDTNQILSFSPNGKFHWLSKKNNKHSRYSLKSEEGFYGILGGHPDSVKKAIVHVPITMQQKQLLDSISICYLAETPYDYAFLGMRCGAATYEVLGQLGIVHAYSIGTTSRKIFYPKKLRKPLLKEARLNGWKIERQEGSKRRKWERD
jgi:hypothetical protein